MITSYSQVRRGEVTTVTVTSTYTTGVYYHWYLDGTWVETTRMPSRSFVIPDGSQSRVECIDSNDSSYQPPAKFGREHSARRTVWWIRSLAADVAKYKVEYEQDESGTWVEAGEVARNGEAWTYEFTSPPLVDLTQYAWRITPIDNVGNEGTAIESDSILVVRWPDAPDFDATFDPATSRVTFAEAS